MTVREQKKKHFEGVWANKNCELVRTSRFSILFERVSKNILVSLKLLNIEDNVITFDTRGIVVFDSAKKKAMIKAKNLLTGDRLLKGDFTSSDLKLNRKKCAVEDAPQKFVLKSEGRIVEELSKYENKLKLPAYANKWQTLDLVEKIKVVEPYRMRYANKDNIGLCLQEWMLGTRPIKDEEGNVTAIVIGTNRHNYIFGFGKWNDTEVIYCRAARIRSKNNGMVFSQNVRLMKNSNEFTARMADNNLETTRRSVVVDDSVFTANACQRTEGAIYWSLKSFDENSITINGCEGEDKIVRPQKSGEDLLEWFEYINYGS